MFDLRQQEGYRGASNPNRDAARPLEVLLVCDRPREVAATLHHHIDGLTGLSRHRITPLPMLGDLPSRLDLERFDAIVVHWSLVAAADAYISPAARARIGAFGGLKAAFIQDEYRFVDRSVAAFRKLGIHILFTCVPPDEIEKVYPAAKLPGVRKVNTLTGYVDPALLRSSVPAWRDRPIDVGYRARKLPPWLGALGQEKHRIADHFVAVAPRYGLKTDISTREEDRIYGENWTRFVANCKAMLGVESGASVFDFDGSIQAACEAALTKEPDLAFETLRARYFAAADGAIGLNQISPRCFEAAALRTLMILYEGDYSGRLVPWQHYVPLRKDHANTEEVIAVLQDPDRACAIVDRAYREVAENQDNAFSTFVREFDTVLSEEFLALGRPLAAGYGSGELRSAARLSLATRRRLIQREIIFRAHKILFGFLLGRAEERTRTRVKRALKQLMAIAKRARR